MFNIVIVVFGATLLDLIKSKTRENRRQNNLMLLFDKYDKKVRVKMKKVSLHFYFQGKSVIG